MKRSTSLLLLSALVVSLTNAPATAAANKIGGPCKVLNQKVSIGKISATCSKAGKALVWKKTPVAKPTSAAKSSPSASAPSTSPSATVSSKASSTPSIASQSAYSISVTTGSWFFNFAYSIDGFKGELKSDPAKAKTLYLPVGKLVQLTLTNSSDAAHGFWIPGLLIDKEVLPGNKASLEFTPDKIGIYSASCNIQCGRDHFKMVFRAEVVSEADYLKYLSSLKS
jgi:heme/copper-type cytochrome/quinol oxidase subunit 2